MDEVFVPKNGNGGYHVEVVRREGVWIIDGLQEDFSDLTSVNWSHFHEMSKRGYEKAKTFLLKNGFKLRT